jgi:hypothetical protein
MGNGTLRRKYGAAWRISLKGARTWILSMMSKVSSGVVCSILSNVKPAMHARTLASLHLHKFREVDTDRC